eukprot:g7426.t1
MLTLLVGGALASASINYSTVIDVSRPSIAWEGWGTSLCWWAKAFGNRDDIADALFTLQEQVAVASTAKSPLRLPGLGLTVARYNAGATTNTPAGGDTITLSPNVSPTRLVDAFWLTWEGNTSATVPGTWDWSRDAAQRAMLLKAQRRGADKLQLFSNSPVWWQCTNHNPSGNGNGAKDNLQSWNREQHAVYLAEVARHAKAEWNVTFQSVEAFNEPASAWWKATGTQEGCHFDASTQAVVIAALRRELDARGLGAAAVAASDENTYTLARSTWAALGAQAQADVAQVNVHGYEYGGGRRDLLAKEVRADGVQRRLWNSEYGEGDASGLQLATNLNLDLKWLSNMSAWTYWQALDGGGWGLLAADNSNAQVQGANAKFFVLAQYSRHIRPGMRLVDGGADANTVAALDAASGVLVIVTTNYANAQWVTYDLSKLTRAAGPVTRWATSTGSAGDRYKKYAGDTPLAGASFSAHFPANTVMTFEVAGVEA